MKSPWQKILLTLTLAVAGPAALADAPGSWSSLSQPQQRRLAPLEKQWPQLAPPLQERLQQQASTWDQLNETDRLRFQRHLEFLANRGPESRAGEPRESLHRQWLSMDPEQRARLRAHFEEIRQLPVEQRRAKMREFRQTQAQLQRQTTTGTSRVDRVKEKPGTGAAATTRREPLRDQTGGSQAISEDSTQTQPDKTRSATDRIQ